MTFASVASIATGGVESAILILLGVMAYKLYKSSMRSKCHTKCCDATFKLPEENQQESPRSVV